MQKLVWQNANGVELDLTSGNYGITEWEGFSNASLNIQSQQVPFQDGGVFLDALIEQRELSVTLAMQDNNNLELRYQQRRELISALNPKLGEGYLIYTNDFISKRIKCVAQIPLFETHNSNDSGTPKASLAWTASNPYWEDLEEKQELFIGGENKSIFYDGDVKSQIEAMYIGTSDEISLENLSNGQKLSLKEIGNNKRIDISTLFGNKNVFATELKKEKKYISLSGIPNVCNNIIFFFNDPTALYAPSFIAYNGEKYIKCDFEQALENETFYTFFINSQEYGTDKSTKILYYNGFYYIGLKSSGSSARFYKSSDLLNWEESEYAYSEIGDYVIRFDEGEQLYYSVNNTDWIEISQILFDEINGYYVFYNNNFSFGTDLASLSTLSVNMPTRYAFKSFETFNGKIYINIEDTSFRTKQSMVYEQSTYLETIDGWCNGGVKTTDNEFVIISNTIIDKNGIDYTAIWNFPPANTNILCFYENRLYVRSAGIYYTENFYNFYEENKVVIKKVCLQNNIYYALDMTLENVYISNDLKEFIRLDSCPQVQIFNDCIGVGNQVGFKIVDGQIVTFSHPASTINSVRKQNGFIYICSEEGLYKSKDFANWETITTQNVLDISDNGTDVVILYYNSMTINGASVSSYPSNYGLKKIEYSKTYDKYLIMGDTYYFAFFNNYFIQISGVSGTNIDLKYDEVKSLWWILTSTKCYTYYRDLLEEIDVDCEKDAELTNSKNGVCIVNYEMWEVSYKAQLNLISHLTLDSDVNFCLDIGTNIILFSGNEKSALLLKYRRKYIGV